MTLPEFLLIIGTFGICAGVWITLVVTLKQNNRKEKSNEVRTHNNKKR
jgi:hypothetical protein